VLKHLADYGSHGPKQAGLAVRVTGPVVVDFTAPAWTCFRQNPRRRPPTSVHLPAIAGPCHAFTGECGGNARRDP